MDLYSKTETARSLIFCAKFTCCIMRKDYILKGEIYMYMREMLNVLYYVCGGLSILLAVTLILLGFNYKEMKQIKKEINYKDNFMRNVKKHLK